MPQRLLSWSTRNSPKPPGSSFGDGARISNDVPRLETSARRRSLAAATCTSTREVASPAPPCTTALLTSSVMTISRSLSSGREATWPSVSATRPRAAALARRPPGSSTAAERTRACGQLPSRSWRAERSVRPAPPAQRGREGGGAPGGEGLQGARARAVRAQHEQGRVVARRRVRERTGHDPVAEAVGVVRRGGGGEREPLQPHVERLAAQL